MGMFKRVPKEIRDEIIAKARSGEKITELANTFGLSSKTIYTWLTNNSGDVKCTPLSRHQTGGYKIHSFHLK